jgi:large subunit ribosomal protein L3
MPLRTGALATKKGMTAIYDPTTAKRTACTVLQLDRCQVLGHKRRDEHGYWAVQVGSGSKEARNVSRPERGHYAAQGVPLKRHLAEFRVKDASGLPAIGSIIPASLFQLNQFVDVRADRRGMGFAGGMKRHNFKGQPASHGNSLKHRAMGSSGASQGSGSRVLPGKRMPGRMGGNQQTVQNLKVMMVDEANGVVVVHGAVPGPKHCVVKIQDALRKDWPDAAWPPTEVVEILREGVEKEAAA